MDDATRRRLAELKSECGCRAGAATMLLFLGAYAVFAGWMDSVSRGTRQQLVIVACVALAGAVIGKLVGVLWARYQYLELSGRVKRRDEVVQQ